MSHKVRRRRKPLPTILKTPIQYSLDLTRGLAGSVDDAAQSEGLRISGEIKLRLEALASYYDVKTEPRIDLLALVLRMACDQFRGFHLELEGSSITKKVKWTFERKTKLLAQMRANITDRGMTEPQAAVEYQTFHAATYDEWLEPTGIISRFHEFQAWEQSGNLSGRERIDFAKRTVRQNKDLADLAERLERARPTESRCPK